MSGKDTKPGTYLPDLLFMASNVTDGAASQLLSVASTVEDEAIREELASVGITMANEAYRFRQLGLHAAQPREEMEAKNTGESKDVSDDFLFAVFDQRRATDRGKDNIKWHNPHTRSTKKRGICFHHTAVKGGFGAWKSRIDFWKKQGISNRPSLLQPNGTEAGGHWIVMPSGNAWHRLTEDQKIESWARAMALGDRYRAYPIREKGNSGVPYHAVMAANSVLYLNLYFDWRTWHGDGSNDDFIGAAWDANSSHDTFDPRDIARDIEKLLEVGREDSHFRDGCELTVHCAWTNKTNDPGKEFCQFLVDIAPKLGCTINVDFKARSSYRSIREVLSS